MPPDAPPGCTQGPGEGQRGLGGLPVLMTPTLSLPRGGNLCAPPPPKALEGHFKSLPTPPGAHEDVANDHRTLGIVPPPTSSPHGFSIPTAWAGGSGVPVLGFRGLAPEFQCPHSGVSGTPHQGFGVLRDFRGPTACPYLHRPMQPLQPPGGAHEGVSSTAGFGVGEGPVLALLDTPRLPGVIPGVCGNNEGPALTCRAPTPRQLPTVGPSPCCTLTRVGAHPARRGNTHLGARGRGHPPWGAARWPCELGGAGRRHPGALRCFPGTSSSSALGTSRSSVRALRGTLVTAAGTAPGSGSGRPRGLGVLLAGTPP